MALAALPALASAAGGNTSYAVGTAAGDGPGVDGVLNGPWTTSQGLSTASFGAGTFDGSPVSAYPSSDLDTFSFAGPTTSSANSSTEPNVATYPAASGDEPFPSGFAGTPGPLSGYCGSSYSDSWDTSDTATSGNPNETGTPVSEPIGETLPFSPYYFPYVVLNSDGSLTGYFDWRPKDADEAIVVAKSTDGGQTWTVEGKALDQNGTYCPSGDTNDDGEGHPYVAQLGSSSDLYTLQRALGDYPGSDLDAFPITPSASNPLSGLQATTSVGVDPNTFATSSTPLSSTPTSIPVSTLGGDTANGNSTSETDSSSNTLTVPDPSALPTGAAQYEDLTQGTSGQQPPVITCTGTSGSNGNSPALVGCTNPQGITVGANDDLVEVIGTAQTMITDSSGNTATSIPYGPQNEAQTLGTDITLNATSANTDTLTYLLNANAPDRYYVKGQTVYCSQANAEPTTKIELCTTTDSSGVGVTTGSASTGTPVTADPVIPSAGANYTGGPVTQTNGLTSPDGIIGPLPASANSAWNDPSTGNPEPSTGKVVLYTEKIANYFVEGGINGTESTGESSTYTNFKKDTAGVFTTPQTGTNSTLQTGFVAAPGATPTDYNISPFPTESEPLPASGSFKVYVGGQTASGGADLDTLTCTGWDVNTHLNDLYNPNLRTIDLLGCTGGVSNDGFNAGHQGNWVAGPGASIETENSSGVPVLPQIGEGKAITKGQAEKLFGNNEDYEVVRAAYTTDGINFTDLGAISGSDGGTGSTSGSYDDLTDPSQQDSPAGDPSTGGIASNADIDPSNPQGDAPTSLPQGTADTTELRWPGARGTIVTNPDGTLGLFLSGAWASDGDSDAFNQIFYASSSDGGKTWSVPTVVLSTDYTFSASFDQDQALADGNDPALGVSAYYSGRAYDPTVVQNPNGTVTLVFAGYRLPNPVKAAETPVGTEPPSQYEEGATVNGSFETDPAIYRNILTATLDSSTFPRVGTSSSLASSRNPDPVGTKVTYTDTVTVPSPGTGTPTGTVEFEDDGTVISGCSAQPLSDTPGSDTATCTTTPAAGFQTITAVYSGDSNYATSSAPAFTETVYNQLSGNTDCNGPYGGTGQNVTVSSGEVCTLVPGTQVNGNVQVNQGGALDDEGANIKGNVQANNSAWIEVTGGATINGNLQVQGLTGAPANSDNYLCATTINGNVQVQNNGSGAPIDIGDLGACSGGPGLTIGSNLQVQNNAGPLLIGGNTVKGNVQVSNNTGGGTFSGNAAGGDCQLQNDNPGIAGSGNSAGPGHQNTCDRTA